MPVLLALLALIAVAALGCGQAPAADAPGVPPTPDAWGALASLDPVLVRAAAGANRPDADGALGRNRAGYFSVVFQRGATWPLAHGVLAADTAALGAGVRAFAYGLARQDAGGAFPIVVPPEMASGPGPGEGDVASAAAFFASELGHALLLLDAARRDPALAPRVAPFAARVDVLRARAAAPLVWLRARERGLMAYDADAPNRLLFDAMALYLTGRALGDAEAVAAGRRFARAALARQRADGVFVEKGGHDTSYQAVALLRALVLWHHLGPDDEALSREVWDAIVRGIAWERGRVRATGEIMTDGNTRVYNGGEAFLGAEKGMAWADAAVALGLYAHAAGDPGARATADRIAAFYTAPRP